MARDPVPGERRQHAARRRRQLATLCRLCHEWHKAGLPFRNSFDATIAEARKHPSASLRHAADQAAIALAENGGGAR